MVTLNSKEHETMMAKLATKKFKKTDDEDETNVQQGRNYENTLQNVESVLAAVQQNWMALEHVPFDLRTRDICMAAVKQNATALQYVPSDVKIKNPDICMTAVKQDGTALKYVPFHNKTIDLCIAALKQTPDADKFIPDHIKNEIESLTSLHIYKNLPSDVANKIKDFIKVGSSRKRTRKNKKKNKHMSRRQPNKKR